MTTPPKTYRPAEVCAALKISPNTLNTWRKTGKLKPDLLRPGRWALYTEGDLERARALANRLQAPERAQVLEKAAVKAAAELRHAYRCKDDWELVARAIRILERATTGGAR